MAIAQEHPVEQRAWITTVNGKTLSAAEVNRFVENQMTALGIPGLSLAIINDGRIVYHRALGVKTVEATERVDENSIFEAASLSKPVFAYFVMRMVDDGVLNLDTPLHTYLPFPELSHDQRYERVTARMVLNHTTGFPNWRWFDPAPPELGVPRGEMYIKYEPGTFSYSGEAYHYLAQVIAHLTGTDMTTLDERIEREVSKPLELKHAYWTWDDFLAEHKVTGHQEGVPVGRRWPRSFPDDDSTKIGVAGRLHTEARSYARFLIALMDGTGLRAESAREMLRVQSRVPEDHDMYLHTGATAWGLGVGMEPTLYGVRYEHGGNNGGFQSEFMFYKAKRLGYVFMTNCDQGAELNDRLEAFLTEGTWSPGNNR